MENFFVLQDISQNLAGIITQVNTTIFEQVVQIGVL